MKITFLGTGTSQGIPVIGCKCEVCLSLDPKDQRLRSSILIETGNHTLLIDSGPDFRQQMLREKVERLDAVLFTHGHRDHIAGLDDVRAYNYIQKKPMDVYGEEGMLGALNHEFPYIFAEHKYPGVPELTYHSIENRSFTIGDVLIEPVRAMHHTLPVLGYRIGDFAYITDANSIPEMEMDKLKGLKYFVLGALRKIEHISHFSLPQALDIIGRIGPEKAVLTHISHQMGLQKQLMEELPENVSIAWDGLKLAL